MQNTHESKIKTEWTKYVSYMYFKNLYALTVQIIKVIYFLVVFR